MVAKLNTKNLKKRNLKKKKKFPFHENKIKNNLTKQAYVFKKVLFYLLKVSK